MLDHTVKPILLYCSEIWGCYLPKSADFNFMFDYSRLSSVLPCDKLHIHFCKYILNFNFSFKCIMLIFKHIVNSCIVITYILKSLCRPEYQVSQPCTKFRISNHKLKIETGRYSKPIAPLENRICEKCFSDETESEEHLLLKCYFYYNKT
jgi:hypothetical protein